MSKRFKVLVGSVIAILLVSLFVAFSGKGQTDQSKRSAIDQLQFGQGEKVLDDDARPIVNFDNAESVKAAEKNTRQLKNSRHNKESLVLRNPNTGVGEVIREPEWEAGLSDLPAHKSDIVVEGIVADTKAFLSEDKTGIYSEFTIRVSKVMKVVSGLSVNLGDLIVSERFGGKVRYPSGQVVLYRIGGQGAPMGGKRYLFFLARAEQGNYKLLTAYEIQGQKVFALDGSRINFRGRGNSKFDKHNGEELDVFMTKVELAVTNSQAAGKQP